MGTDNKNVDEFVMDACRLRDQTQALLDRLVADRAESEHRQHQAGRRDPLKVVTGRSALDQAIEAAREMLDRVNALANARTGASPADLHLVDIEVTSFNRPIPRTRASGRARYATALTRSS